MICSIQPADGQLNSNLHALEAHGASSSLVTSKAPPRIQWYNFRQSRIAFWMEDTPASMRPGRFIRLTFQDVRLDHHQHVVQESDGSEANRAEENGGAGLVGKGSRVKDHRRRYSGVTDRSVVMI